MQKYLLIWKDIYDLKLREKIIRKTQYNLSFANHDSYLNLEGYLLKFYICEWIKEPMYLLLFAYLYF